MNEIVWNVRCRPLFFAQKVDWPRDLIIPVEVEEKGVKRRIKVDGNLLGHFLYAIYNFYNAPITSDDLVHHLDDGLNKKCREYLEAGETICWADLMGERIWFGGINGNELILTE